MSPVISVPMIVARGTLRSGFSTRSPAAIALSKPSMANRVRVAAALIGRG